MKVTIEHAFTVWLYLEIDLPIIGCWTIKAHEPLKEKYAVVSDDNGAILKSGFRSYGEAEHWTQEQGYHLV